MRIVRADIDGPAVVKPRVCQQCGATFEGGPRAMYCPACRLVRRREADKRFRAKGRKADRPLGSIDLCARCGREYIVNSSHQKYCPSCAPHAIREADRASSRAWNQAHKETLYQAKNEKRRKKRYCIICGALITAKTATITCDDPECKRERARQRDRAAYARRMGLPIPDGYAPTKKNRFSK